ncbi:type I DNA topoisomerase [Alphaproteobacteria bacterium HT1-32]|nr:type I DNA topoisomerase [Alphaproteobacteria bacterium HT1-32]
MNVVVVESPAKAKTINKYLGKDYVVLASFGHVRDLPPKDGSVDPDQDFNMLWQVQPDSERHLKEITKAVKGADKLFLATDPDREGEAISWHVLEELQRRKALKNVDVKRVVFNEITKTAVTTAMQNPRDIDRPLVDAYLARRALDYLVGFTLSPILWRKLPKSRSAGRVQSVALRLVCEREAEIEVFKPQEYWSVTARLANGAKAEFDARLARIDGKRLDKFELGNAGSAETAADLIKSSPLSVTSVEKKRTQRRPQPPFTTSTLQQEAARKLYFGAKRTMQLAQKLYEGMTLDGETVGLITYMRTDGVQMANEAIEACRTHIGGNYGSNYVPKEPRIYKTKAKNAQEAHEAIRPTDVTRTPEMMRKYLDQDQQRLYELIWLRTIASQMEAAQIDQVGVDIDTKDGKAGLRATGSTIAFDGFLKVYREGMDDSDGDDDDRRLPPLNEGEAIDLREVLPEQHFTQPPPRYSEASLVKKMEELGIGRPSTYASVLSVLQDRGYVRLDNRRFIPEDMGRLVTTFLTNFFERYIQYNFTADLENKLDEISADRVNYKVVLHEFWDAFHQAVDGAKDLTITNVIDALDEALGPHFFPETEENQAPRNCPSCDDGRLGLKLGKFGAFIGCSNYPECKHTRKLEILGDGEDDGAIAADGPVELGEDPETGKMITLRKGPYGHYVQLGEPEEKKKPKRASLPKGLAPADVDLEKAIGLLRLPRDVGPHPETGEMIQAGLGRFGPYLKYDGGFTSLPADDDLLSIGLNRAVTIIAEAQAKKGGGKAIDLGAHPDDKKPVKIKSGRFGPYAEHGKIRATLPKGTEMDSVTLEQAVELIAAKAAKGGKTTKAKTTKAKTTKAKTTKAKPKTRESAA